MKMISNYKSAQLFSALIASAILLNGATQLKADKPSYGASQEDYSKEETTSKKPGIFKLFPGMKAKEISAPVPPAVTAKERAEIEYRRNVGRIQQVQHTTSGNSNITSELEKLYQQEGRTMPDEMYSRKYRLVNKNNQEMNTQQNPNQGYAQTNQKPKKKIGLLQKLFGRKSRPQPKEQSYQPQQQQQIRQNNMNQANYGAQNYQHPQVQQAPVQRKNGNYAPRQFNNQVNNRVNTNGNQQVENNQGSPLPSLPLPEDIKAQPRKVVPKPVQVETEAPPKRKSLTPQKKDEEFIEFAQEVEPGTNDELIIPDVPHEKILKPVVQEKPGIAVVKKVEKPKETQENITEKLNRGEFENPFTDVSEEEADKELFKSKKPVENLVEVIEEEEPVKLVEKPVTPETEELAPVADTSEENESPFSGLTLKEEKTEVETKPTTTEEAPEPEMVKTEKYDSELELSSGKEEIEIKPLEETAIKSAKPIEIRKVTLGLEGHCPVSLRNQRRLVKGEKTYRSKYYDVTYYFSSPEAKVKFDEYPHFYAPVEAGQDVVALESGEKGVKGSLEFGAWYQGRLYLFSNAENKKAFSSNPSKYTENLF